MEKNILLKIKYDGTDFSGWQRQPNVRTGQGEIEAALSKVTGLDVKIEGTSRTDAGVHAMGQMASFKGDFGIPVEKLKYVANNILWAMSGNKMKSPDIEILEVAEVDLDFHARFDSVGKTYKYIIEHGKDFDIFNRNYAYQIRELLDVEKIKSAAQAFVGEKDFKGFQSSGGTPRESTIRKITSMKVEVSSPNRIEIFVTGNGFLYNMVRIIVGTLVDIGLGKISLDEIDDIIKSCDRCRAGHTAPPQGLYLLRVYYDISEMEKE